MTPMNKRNRDRQKHGICQQRMYHKGLLQKKAGPLVSYSLSVRTGWRVFSPQKDTKHDRHSLHSSQECSLW